MRPYYLLDTNIVCEPSKKLPDSQVMEKLKQNAPFCAISSITVAEIQRGILLLPENNKKENLHLFFTEEVLPLYSQTPFDTHSAVIYGNIMAELEKQGKPKQKFDLLIASIAIANNMILITRNTGDFTDIPGLIIENWFEKGV